MNHVKTSQSHIHDASSADWREAFEHCFDGTLIGIDRDILALDPAERLEFSRMRGFGEGAVARFDKRPDSKLRECMSSHPLALERERAAWELGDRLKIHAIPEIREMLLREADSDVRRGLLWLVQKHGGLRAIAILRQFIRDDDVEVREWAEMLLMESERTPLPEVTSRPTKRNAGNVFDQTLPLVISGFARTYIPGLGWVQVTLSPKWFELILGRVMACTRDDTFERALVIEKRLKGFHPDNTDHYEIFKFRGFSHSLDAQTMHHQYESFTNHTFYPSGLVEDESKGAVDDMFVTLARVAATIRVPDLSNPNRDVVHSVRGRYMGWAYVDLARVVASGMTVGAGEAQLSSLHHRKFGHLTNTFLFGSFKGKLSDLDGDGVLDVNTEVCHGNLDGDLDYFADGSGRGDPYDPFSIR